MHFVAKQLSPLTRLLAGVTLLMWLAGLGLCTVHCSLGVGHCGTVAASCHGSATPACHQEDRTPCGQTDPDSPVSFTCGVLKSALLSGHAPVLHQPDFQLVYFLAPFALGLDTTLPAPTAVIFRQAQHRDWIFTPEVCLGPAFRSHAPPFLS